jgi:eukaryotic-like serine/threonine-protein kinase
MTRMTDQIGRVLGGRYRLISPLGSGASAQVYLADDVRLRRRVAVKVLHPALADDESFLRRFRAEAQSAASLSHPHLLAVFDWSGGDDDSPYLVTEYLSGGSLRAMLDAGHRLSPGQALVVGLEASRALDHAHRQGFVHRDIKPANLLFGADGRLRVADFGLARAIAEAGWTEPAGAVVGTARYASPEQARGESVDGRSDVYSLALVLVEAVTGTVPFAADTTIATLMARLDHSLGVPDEMGALQPVLEQAGRLDLDGRLDAAGLGKGLIDAATELTRPDPLPLAGGSGTASGGPDARDATLLGPTAASAAVAAVAAVAPLGVGAAGAAGNGDGAGVGAVATAGARAYDGSQTTVVVSRPGPDATNVLAAPPAGLPPAPSSGPPWRPRDGEPAHALSPNDRGARRLMFGALVVVLAVAVGVAGGWAYVRARVPSHTVPELIGMNRTDALGAVADYDWTIDEELVRRDGTEEGEVLEADPAPGEELREGGTLRLVVSEGAPLVDVPAGLVGSTQAAAVAALEAAGLVAQVVPQADEDIDEGIVIGFADGEPEAQLPRGSTVRLAVSAGDELEVPDVEGWDYGDAVAELEARGFDTELEQGDADGDRRVGEVIGTDPEAGDEADAGDTVTVIVAVDEVDVPEVTGMSLDEARGALEDAGLSVGRVNGPDDGTVVATWPLENSEVPEGTSVDLTVRRR